MFFRVIGRLTIRFLLALGRVIVNFFRGLIRHPVGSLFSLIIIGGLVASWIFTDGFGFNGGGTPDNSRQAEAAIDKTNSSTKELMVGLTSFNSARVWKSFSPAYQKELTDKGITADTIQKNFEKFKKDAADNKSKLNYVGYLYRETLTFPNGTSTDSYVSVLQVEDSVQPFQYMILLDKSRQISAIGTDDPVLSQIIGRKKQTTGP